MKHPDSNVAMQAVEFWSTVCDEEINLNKEALQVTPCLRLLDRGPALMLRTGERIRRDSGARIQELRQSGIARARSCVAHAHDPAGGRRG